MIQNIRKENQIFQGQHEDALQQLAKTISTTAEKISPTTKTTNQTSSTPTSPSQIRTAPCIHQHVTRENTPGIIPTTPTPPS